MKQMCCRLKISTLARMLIFVDIFRGMLVSALLVGLFCGMSTVYLEKLEEDKYGNSTVRVDYHWHRQVFVGCIVIGIIICGADILMALALDNILNKNLGKASLIWMNCSLIGIFLRCSFFAFLWKNEKELGLDRLDKLTPTVKWITRMLFVSAVAYELVKVLQLVAGTASQMEFRSKEKRQNKKVPPRRVVVGMIGGAKRWID